MTSELSADDKKLERRCKPGQAFRRLKNNKLHPIHEELEFNFVLAARRRNYLGSVGPVTSPLSTASGRAASEEIRGPVGELYHTQVSIHP
jgi:hypothetical protein